VEEFRKSVEILRNYCHNNVFFETQCITQMTYSTLMQYTCREPRHEQAMIIEQCAYKNVE